jgi:hypothetical protein
MSYLIPFAYPSVSWPTGAVPSDYTAAALWQQEHKVSGTAGQVLYAYRDLGGGDPLSEWLVSPPPPSSGIIFLEPVDTVHPPPTVYSETPSSSGIIFLEPADALPSIAPISAPSPVYPIAIQPTKGPLLNDFEAFGDIAVPSVGTKTYLAGYQIFTPSGTPTGNIAPVSSSGISGALGLPAFGFSEPQLNLRGETLFTKIETPDISPYADFASKTFGDFPIPTETPTKSQLNAYKFAFTQGAAGATAPEVPYPISSHIIAATKGTPLAGVGEFTSGMVGGVESIWNPKAPSVWNVGYEKLGLQKGTYASDIMKQYPGYAAGNVVSEFIMLGAPTGASVPKLLGKLGGKVEVYMGLRTYPELKLGNMIRTYKQNQAVVRTIRGMEGGTVKMSESFAPRVASSWFTEGEMKGLVKSMDDLPSVRAETAPKRASSFTEVSQGQRIKTTQLLQMERPKVSIMSGEKVEMPSIFPKLMSPSRYRQLLMAEEYGLDFYTIPLPRQVARPPELSTRSMSAAWSTERVKGVDLLKQPGKVSSWLSPKVGDIYAQTSFSKQFQELESSLIPKVKLGRSPVQAIGTESETSTILKPYSIPGTRESYKTETTSLLKSITATMPSSRVRQDLPRKMRIDRDSDWLPKAARRGGSYEERINPFNENFIRDLRRLKL